MKRICISLFFVLSLSAFGEETPIHGAATLMKGAVYYDSQVTYREALALSMLRDTEALTRLVKIGHISAPTDTEQDIIVLYTGSDPDSPAEFSFLSGPTTYWTLSKYLLNYSKADPTPTPSPPPLSEARPSDFSSRTPEATPTPEASPSPPVAAFVPQKKVRHRPDVNNSEDISAGGRKVWHLVNGNLKWYYEKWPPKEVKEEQQKETQGKLPKLLRPGPDDPEPGYTKE